MDECLEGSLLRGREDGRVDMYPVEVALVAEGEVGEGSPFRMF